METSVSAFDQILSFLASIDSLVTFAEAVFVSVSAVYAALLYRHTTKSARRSSMIQMLLDRSHDERLINADKHIRKLFKENNSSLKRFVDEDTEDRAAILIVGCV